MTCGSVEKVLVLSVVMYKWGGHERSWTCAICPCGVGSEPGSCTCLQSSFFSAAFHSAAVVSDFMFDALRGLDVSRSGSSSGRAWRVETSAGTASGARLQHALSLDVA